MKNYRVPKPTATTTPRVSFNPEIINILKLTLRHHELQPQWNRPPSTPSADGATKKPTTSAPPAAATTARPTTQKPVMQTTQKPVQQTTQKPVQQTTKKPMQQTTQKPVQKPITTPAPAQGTVDCSKGAEYIIHAQCDKV